MLFHFPSQNQKKSFSLIKKKQCKHIWTKKGNKIAHDEYHRFCDKALESNYWKWLLLLFGASRLFDCHDTAILLRHDTRSTCVSQSCCWLWSAHFCLTVHSSFWQGVFVSALGFIFAFACVLLRKLLLHCQQDYSRNFFDKFLNFPPTFNCFSEESGRSLVLT